MISKMVSKDITIEELVNRYPVAVQFLSEQGIRCIRCGEPIWGTLEEAALEKGFNHKDIEVVVEHLNKLISGEEMIN
jgi:methionine synthase II (cobalamin-independent)